jgi:phosphoribosylglycinamide formyltransferase 1
MTSKIPIAILISGRGSNMLSLIEACEKPDFPARIALVLSNRPEAGGLQIATQHSIKTIALNHKEYASRQEFDEAVHKAIKTTDAEIICLAGYMRLVTPWFVNQWEGRILNIHPSLLPDFKGANAHRDVLAAGVTKSGCTVHMVTAEMDSGRILGQAEVPVLPDDTEETLAARVLEQEHILYPKCLREFLLLHCERISQPLEQKN